MKKLLFFIIIIVQIVLPGCTDTMADSPNVSTEQGYKSNSARSKDEILEIARSAASIKVPNARSNDTGINEESITPICRPVTRSNTTDTILYAVNFEDNQGFVIISANQSIEPIIFLADNGSFDNAETTQNINFQYFLSSAMEYADSKSKESSFNSRGLDFGVVDIMPKMMSRTTASNEVGPYLQVSWGRGWPENMFCPNSDAGCGPVAVAQLMASMDTYWGDIKITYPGSIGEWIKTSKLMQHKISIENQTPADTEINDHCSSCSLNTEGHQAIGKLVREIGHRAKADYFESYTYTSLQNLYIASKEILGEYVFNIGECIETYDYDYTMYNILNSFDKNTLLVEGQTSSGDIHQWVADGTIQFTTENIWTKNGQTIKTEIIGPLDYVHHNWGFGGNCNGYCLDNIFNSAKAVSKDFFYTSQKGQDYSIGVRYFIVNLHSPIGGL